MNSTDLRCPDCGQIHWTRGSVAVQADAETGQPRAMRTDRPGPDEWTCGAEGCGYRVDRPSEMATLLDDIAHLRVP